MSCKDCYNNCGQAKSSDQCVQVTLDDITEFDFCSGEPQSKLNDILVTKLLSVLDGTAIEPKDVTLEDCIFFKDNLGDKDPTLTNLLQTIIDTQCSFNEAISALQDTEETFTFDLKCLDAATTRDGILQAAINKICSINSTISSLPTTYLKISDVKTQVTNIITESGTAATQFYNRAIPYVAMEYYGPLSNFDSTGKGLLANGFDKIYLCNGLNGTPDKRGRVAVGAVANVPGGTLDAAVDPTNSNNPNTNYALKDKFGESFHKQTVTELPSHSHSVTDPMHDHDYEGFNWEKRPGGNNVERMDSPTPKKTSKAPTGISIGSTGGGQAFNVRQPSIAAYYIMYIPS